jgi:hypothetical protein
MTQFLGPEDLMNRNVPGAFRMRVKSRGQDKFSLAGHQFGLAEVNCFRGQQPDRAVAMLAVVPGEESLG